MQGKKLWQDLLDRERNFRNPVTNSIAEDSSLQIDLERLYLHLEEVMPTLGKLGPEHQLACIFERVIDFVSHNVNYLPFTNRELDLYEPVFDACFFTGLCLFLHDTKRINTSPLSQFVYRNSNENYNVEGTPNYFDPKYQKKGNEKRIIFDSEVDKLRQYRHRQFKQRAVDIRPPEWGAMSEDSEYEWGSWYDVVNPKADSTIDPIIPETLKRVKNLYSDITAAINSTKDKEYKDRIKVAFNKFLSKLEKIQYADYLKLCKYFLDHIEQDKKFYGINLYRFEKQWRLLEISQNVNCLLKCKDENVKSFILYRSVAISDVWFPWVRQSLCRLPHLEGIKIYAKGFLCFMDEVIRISRLIIDKFVENGIWGEDWKEQFTSIINEMASRVFYAPEFVDYTIQEKSQEAFFKVMMIPIYVLYCYAIEDYEHPSDG